MQVAGLAFVCMRVYVCVGGVSMCARGVCSRSGMLKVGCAQGRVCLKSALKSADMCMQLHLLELVCKY